MIEVVISADLHCAWDQEPPAYRIYVDDDLLTERTYRWINPEQYICEFMTVRVVPGMHSLRVEAVNPAYQEKFILNNVHINRQAVPYVNNQILIQ